MEYFIKVTSIITSQGNITDITSNNAEVLKEAIARSSILNNKNTYPDPLNPKIYQSEKAQTLAKSQNPRPERLRVPCVTILLQQLQYA